MRTVAYVISDLHLGGAPDEEGRPGFQMTSPETVRALASFIEGLPKRSECSRIHLIVAGDVVDFLAEEPFEAFTASPASAAAKLERIFETTAPFWSALRAFNAHADTVLTLLLGNHDIELCLPGVRERLEQEVMGKAVRFIYDNEALTLPGVLIEHGNRFDAWNAVPHGALRRVRSQLSRRADVNPEFPALPGSRLVIEVLNKLKQQHPFIDLLKPEGAGALPIAAALGASGVTDILAAFRQYRRKYRVDYDEDGEPLDEGHMGSLGDSSASMSDPGSMFEERDPTTDFCADGEMGARDFAAKLLTTAKETFDSARQESVFKALRSYGRLHRRAFAIDYEESAYLAPAKRAARAGFQVVIFGHTHLPKQLPLDGELRATQYLNTGTWADLMAVPAALWDPDVDIARRAFTRFLRSLRVGQTTKWRRSAPTYARLEFEGDGLVPGTAGVFFADDDSPLSTDGLLRRVVAEVEEDHEE